MRTALLTVALSLLAACGSRPPDDALLVLPGDFSQATTVADLEARFGKANVRRVDALEAVGSTEPGIVLFPDDPTRRAYVSFFDDEALTDLASIQVLDAGSRWRGKQGVHVGMSLAELQKVNGKPFYFQGFDEQGRAWTRDQWSPALDDDDGALGRLDVEEGEHMYFNVELALRGPVADVPADAYPHDEASISSDEPAYPRLGELVVVTGFGASNSLDDEWQ